MRAFRLRKKKASRSARAPPDRMDRTLLARCVSGRRCPIGPLALRASLKKPEFVAAAIGHAADNAIGMPSACFRPMHAWRKGLDGALAKRAIACWTRVRVFLDGSRCLLPLRPANEKAPCSGRLCAPQRSAPMLWRGAAHHSRALCASAGRTRRRRRSTPRARECRPSRSSASTSRRRASTCRYRGSPSPARRSARHTRCPSRRASKCRR